MPLKKWHASVHTQQQTKALPNSNYYSLLQSLTPEQRLLHDDLLLRKRVFPLESIHLFLIDTARTGKTFTLCTIVQGLLHHYSNQVQADIELPTILLMAYIGKAALNIERTTIHSVLSLPLKMYKI